MTLSDAEVPWKAFALFSALAALAATAMLQNAVLTGLPFLLAGAAAVPAAGAPRAAGN